MGGRDTGCAVLAKTCPGGVRAAGQSDSTESYVEPWKGARGSARGWTEQAGMVSAGLGSQGGAAAPGQSGVSRGLLFLIS